MKPIDQQFRDIIDPRLQRINDDVARPMAEQINDKMKENTSQGTAFGADTYDAQYSRRRKRERRAMSLQTSHVDLRARKRRIESAQVHTVGHGDAGVQIAFDKGGDIFKEHHTGRAPGNKMRSIFPKSIEAVPDQIINDTKQALSDILSGRK